MTRIPFPDLSAAPDHIREQFEKAPFDLAVLHMFAHATAAFDAWRNLNRAVLTASDLDTEVRELAICVVTAADSPGYEHAYHRLALLGAGITETQLEALEDEDYESESFTERQRAVLVFAHQVHRQVKASDEALAELRRHLSDRQVVELILCIGQYMLNSRVSENAGLTVEDDRQFAKPGQPMIDPPPPRSATRARSAAPKE